MTDRPYTDDDLRAEAARQHKTLTEDPDYVGIGEQMDGMLIDSTVMQPDHDDTGTTWDELSEDDFDTARCAIDKLLRKAANTSSWAINLGADGLVPSDDHVITLNAGDRPIVRVHFAFEPDMPEDLRTDLVQGLGDSINAHLRPAESGAS